MRKKIVSALAAAAIMAIYATPAKAQDIFDSGDMRPHFGARLSLDISNVAGNIDNYFEENAIPDLTNSGAGFTVMGVYNIPLYKNLYFEPGLGIYYNTVGLNGTHYDFRPNPEQPESPIGVADYAIDGSVRNWGFRIPMLAGYHFDFTDNMRVSVFTGPQINIGFYQKMVYDVHYIGDSGVPADEHVSASCYGHGFRRFDMQWVFGAGYHYGRYSVAISGGVGMTNLVDGQFSGYKARRNTFSITLGYDF